MRHGRAKAARKTLKYFERSVNLKSKPYYCVLLDATFLIAMIRITSNNGPNVDAGNEGVSQSESTIVSRIERVLQVNAGGSSFSGHTKDLRLDDVVRGYDNNNSSGYDNDNDYSQQHDINSNHNNNQGSGHRFISFNVRYYVPQEVVDEIKTIIQNFKDRSEQTKKQKKQRKHLEKSKIFEDALAWIKTNSSKKNSHKNTGRCEVLPRLEALVEPSKKKRKQQTESSKNDDDNDNEEEEEATISASDAVRRHIARDDGREDPETNRTTTKKQQQQQQQDAFTRTYIVASQEEDLLDNLRMLGTVPIMRCTNKASVLILENPSKKGQRTEMGKEQSKWHGALSNPAERALVDAAWQAQKKVKITGAVDSEANKRGQNTRAKGPNPLSCKRKRTGGSQQQKGGSGESKSQKRRARTQRNKSTETPAAAPVSPKE